MAEFGLIGSFCAVYADREGKLQGPSQTTKMQTLKHAISCVGVGFHTGARVTCTLHPAPSDYGICFSRVDRPGTRAIAADLRNVADTGVSITLLGERGVRIASIEHLLAALAICEIDNARIEVSGPEVPAMDGSALPFVKLIECAGREHQERPRGAMVLRRPFSFSWGGGVAQLAPSDGLVIDSQPREAHGCPNRWRFDQDFGDETIRQEVVAARTHMFCADLNHWIRKGWAKGASVQNIVIGEPPDCAGNQDLRFSDALARHHVLDLLGEFRLLPQPLRAHYRAVEGLPGLCRQTLNALLADSTAWEVVGSNEDHVPSASATHSPMILAMDHV